MAKKITDFAHLAKVLDENRNAEIPDSHWEGVREMMVRNGKRFEAEEKALAPTDEMMHKRFTV